MPTHASRTAMIRKLDRRLEELKERLRKNHEDGMALVREAARLEHARFEYLLGVNGSGTNHPHPVLILTETARVA